MSGSVISGPVISSAPNGDFILPFQIEGQDVRGRLVRLGPVVDEILTRHDYPDGIANLLAHALTLAAMLGQSLKFDGKLTLQAKGDGAVGMIVADYATPSDANPADNRPGGLRGWVGFDADRYTAAIADGIDPGREVPQLMGAGYLAFTIDQGPDTDRYQGIVPLEGGTLAECAQKYFDDSEQIPTAVKLAARPGTDGWQAGGIMVQHLPPEGATLQERDDDAWREAAILMASARDDELTDPALPATDLLFRLFHENGVRVFEAMPLRVFCQCSRDRVEAILAQFSSDDMADMVVDGQIVMTCEFCNTAFAFDPPASTT